MDNEKKELNTEELRRVPGGVYEDTPHCPKCQGKDLALTGPVDFGTPPCFRCKSCGYEWMMAL